MMTPSYQMGINYPASYQVALKGTLDPSPEANGFWMLYGTPKVAGEPFVWSRSSWSWQKLRDVPDRVDGVFTLMPLHLR